MDGDSNRPGVILSEGGAFSAPLESKDPFVAITTPSATAPFAFRPSSSLSYRRAAVQQASPVGLVVILLDLLVGDLQGAVAAMRRWDIEERTRRLKHGLLVVQLLEGSLDLEHGGETAHILSRFYAHLRNQILLAQFQMKPQLLEDQLPSILDLRQAWCAADLQTRTVSTTAPPVNTTLSWSA